MSLRRADLSLWRRARTSSAEAVREELLAHCYRMVGSLQEADDLLQESLLRAWRAIAGFEGRSSMQHLAVPDRDQRLPAGAGDARPPAAAVRAGRPGRRRRTHRWAPPETEVPWLEPVPDTLGSGRLG